MKDIRLTSQAKKAIMKVDPNFFKYLWKPHISRIIDKSPFLNEKEDYLQLYETVDLIIPRFLEVLAEHPLLKYIDIKSLYYHDFEFTHSSLNRKMRIYNLTEAAKDMMVSESFLRKGLRIGYFSGKKQNGKWVIDEIEHGINWGLLIYLD